LIYELWLQGSSARFIMVKFRADGLSALR
jgi:hypothetical protein